MSTPLNHTAEYSRLLRLQQLCEQLSGRVRSETAEDRLRRVLVEQLRAEGAR